MALYEKETDTALRTVREAAALCAAVQAEISTDILEKEDRSPVTVADFGSQALVCRTLGDAFPGDPILGEEDAASLKLPGNKRLLGRLVQHVGQCLPGAGPDEICTWIDRGGGAEYTERFWTLDPIDGTKGFLRHEQYCISLALIVGGEVVVAVLGCPNLPHDPAEPHRIGTAFFAVQGGGAYQVPLEGESEPVRVQVSSQENTAHIRFCESVEKAHSSHGDAARIAETLAITAPPVRMDSQAKYAAVSRGEAEAYLRLPRGTEYREKIWDHAGGVLVVTEAGGRVTDIAGNPLDFTRGRTLSENRGIIATNGRLHETVLATIRTLGIGGTR